MTDSRRSGSSSLRSKLREIKLAVIESRRARSAQSRRQLGEPDSTGNFDDSNIRKQFRLLSGRLLKVSLQGIVLAVKAIEIGFY